MEHFGGELGVLNYPMHGKPSTIVPMKKSRIFNGFPEQFAVGRYHSLYAKELPSVLKKVAHCYQDNVVMAIEHEEISHFCGAVSSGIYTNVSRFGIGSIEERIVDK